MSTQILGRRSNGTFGFYNALKILGYKPYHQAEVFANGAHHARMMDDAVHACNFGRGKPFNRQDFDKWLGDYDSITDIPAWFLRDLVAAYPDAKFVLIERDPEAWRKSIAKTFLPFGEFLASPAMRLVSLVDPYTCHISRLGEGFGRVLYGGYTGPDKDKALMEAVKVYNNHNKTAKELVPPEKLLVIRLEDGLGWEKICQFLGHEVPDVPYPRVNDAEGFQKLVMDDFFKAWTKTALKLASLVVPLIGASVWYARQR
ncbi:hypothetical protein CkaCkLH20_10186 [Colletotrichum karsti]|uniref:P-loop containing nucleoside triphosphate hydrolase protein n=1 Tax=Colletotrichum karsti TaxID=1095194 RepID=A0A9P6HXH2_9PEZI|nr:uncharacterized protein CkaCkLH20_10186 [Colletotrichum karsti]KAF9872359.1 hypothetical protein CkaCkLH20_10186 [Colletotrichum karsti]